MSDVAPPGGCTCAAKPQLGVALDWPLGAAVAQTPSFTVGALRFTTYTKQGWVVAALNVFMFL